LKFQAVAEKTAKDARGYFILPHPVYIYGYVYSSDITEYPHDDVPSTGMFVFIDGEFPCTAFAFMFLSSCHAHQHKRCTYYVLKICLSLPLSIHPSVHKTLTTTNRFTLHPVNFPTSALICQLGCHKLSWVDGNSLVFTWHWQNNYCCCTLLLLREHVYVFIGALYVCKNFCHVVYMQGVSWSFSALK